MAKGIRSHFIFGAIALGLVVAFRTVLVAPLGLTELSKFEYWFFIPNHDSGALSVIVASWFLWNRRDLFSTTKMVRITWLHWIAVAAILSAYSWAVVVGAQALLIPILCATIATLASAWGGRSALKLVLMPCAALMLAFPPPAPLQAEIIWRLQNITAGGANLILSLAGFDPLLEGTELRLGKHIFIIIEACSGWRGIQVLGIVALAAAELREISFRRALLVAAAAIPLGIGLNVIRACLVMLTQEELRAEFFESHTPQGIAVLLVGAIALYAIAILVEGESVAVSKEHGDETELASEESLTAEFQASRWALFGPSVPVVLAGLSFLIPALHEPEAQPNYVALSFPISLGHWTGEKVGINFFFPYSTPANHQFHADYRSSLDSDGGELVDLFIGWEIPRRSGLDRLPDSKLLLPASDWTIFSREEARIWSVDMNGERAIITRADQSKFSYVVTWRVRDRGLLRESLLSLLGIRACGESTYGCARIVVRISVPIFFDDHRGRERAREVADGFIRDFTLAFRLLATY